MRKPAGYQPTGDQQTREKAPLMPTTDNDSESIVSWEEPPPGRPRRYDWAAIASVLRSRPGRWAVIAEDAYPSISTNIKRGAYTAMRPAGAFEARAVRDDSGQTDIYARYVGEVSE